jgi:glycyl-tRNA synthetase beta chain
MKNLLFEVLTEELPARFIRLGINSLAELTEKYLVDYRLKFKDIKTAGTPRRLVLFVEGLSEKQEDLEEEIIGPTTKVALDEKGNYTKAALGFAAKHGAEPSDLYIKETPRGAYIALKVKRIGEETTKILQTILPKILLEIPFPKKMVWGEVRFPFARPIRSILCLFGEDIVPLEIAGLKSVDWTYGHRYLGANQIKLTSADFDEYVKLLQERWVIVDPDERKRQTEEEIKRITQGKGFPELEPHLLYENANLVEYPFPTLGSFDEKFLRMPEELTKTALQEHQRYFLLRDESGKLLNYFVAVNNNRVRDEKVLIAGHERVAKARLEDALFYYERDLKQSLDQWVINLKGIVYHVRCGTLYEKTERLKKLSVFLAERLGIAPELEKLKKASHYAKADLASEVVKEFPSLQGIMGKYYYLHHFGDEVVARAIEEQYLPNPNDERLPETTIGTILSICDKVDHITALIGVNEKPTGESDPYGLRRAAYGVIKILLWKELDLELEPLIEKACDLLLQQGYLKNQSAKEETVEFLRKRLESEFLSLGYPKGQVFSVIKLNLNPYDQFLRLRAISKLSQGKEFEDLLVPFKRVYAILKNKDIDKLLSPKPELFEIPSEKNLFEAYEEIEEPYLLKLKSKAYEDALYLLLKLKPFIEEFFDKVFVMVDDEKVRANRLSLLKQVFSLYQSFTHFENLV